ncbi:MAG: alanine--tRNA ligase [Betaproteobacteria bacterium]|jgi:alanyl-tRNA synthetase|nr:alanine--tRNA ligase [Betaproteobacteria bacterium]NBT98545.1 alanine--tRNA ligase [Betaproteobacteria bacterium]NCX02137.1 alanine--tRNA ligase [Betaproteobacteria bacterium]NDE30754.1 alanine--tRNA ligase [Betaproteobacteria bacterium]
MKSADIRAEFLAFFAERGHTVVASSSLVPANDPTLLFTNSGMVQFKDVFLGKEQRAYKRATTSQRSVRAGGKHNDLENVGYTARHHTFFEMLGNFSFGDYFKHDAIRFAWDLLTQRFMIPKEKLWVTVYAEDDEAFGIWSDEIGVPKERIIRIGDNKGARYASDNFWQMADTGPCGPCSEIFYDHGPDVAGGPPGSPEQDGDRYIEIWNLVFMQYERDESGVLSALPRPCVDTGMGLERIAAVLQGVHSNYEIDLFQQLIAAAARETNTSDLNEASLRVIADHIRACAFLVLDGVIPGNEGRGYVLRRIIRRALRHGYQLGCKTLFFHRLVDDLALAMGAAYPELFTEQERVKAVLKQEEERFSETLEHGMALLEQVLVDGLKQLDGETAFKLYDTYGFPVDLTADVCRERGLSVDEDGFEAAMARQREQARAAGKFKAAAGIDYQGAKTRFDGYDCLSEDAKVLAIFHEGASVAVAQAGERVVIVLDQTPFYAESGGQVGDRGYFVGLESHKSFEAEVHDTQKISAEVFGHHALINQGVLRVGDVLRAQVDKSLRANTIRNHSATHLMHKALREVLGAHVQQKGSLVDEHKTRFDFSHHSAMKPEEIREVERIVNEEILSNQASAAKLMSFDDAVKAGAMALFGEKYGDTVRVLDIGSSRELCGGTHVERTGDIGSFRIVAESGVAAGIRRVEAITGEQAIKLSQDQDSRLERIAGMLKAPSADIESKLRDVLEHTKAMERELVQLKSKMAAAQGTGLAGQARRIGQVHCLAAKLDAVDPKAMREAMDQLKQQLGSAVIVLAVVEAERVSLVAGVTKDLLSSVKAGDLVNFVAQQIGGKGGGRPDLAQAGGHDVAKLPQALESVHDWVSDKLKEAS